MSEGLAVRVYLFCLSVFPFVPPPCAQYVLRGSTLGRERCVCFFCRWMEYGVSLSLSLSLWLSLTLAHSRESRRRRATVAGQVGSMHHHGIFLTRRCAWGMQGMAKGGASTSRWASSRARNADG